MTVIDPEALEILYRSERVVVVDKPSGLAVHRGWAKEEHYAMTLTRDLLGQYVYPVHRLDRATSGALVFALDKEMANLLQDQFAQGLVKKTYLALVRGLIQEPGCIDHPLRKDGQQDPKAAQTRFVPIGSLEGYAWVLATPKQGRQHQIRRHFKHISRHLIGDVRYGKGEHNRYARETYGLHRLALHALSIGFTEPSSEPVPSEVLIKCAPSGPLAEALAQSMSSADLWVHWDRAQGLWRRSP